MDVEGVTLMIVGGVEVLTAGEEESSAGVVSRLCVDIDRFGKKIPKRRGRKKNLEQNRLL